MTTYRHSGTLGDLIYALYMIKKMGNDPDFQVALYNVEATCQKYGYDPKNIVPEHRGRFTEKDYAWLLPLLERQSYISKVSTWVQGDPEPDVDFDEFRGILYKTFEGNIIETYHRTFNMPFSRNDVMTPWLEADPVRVKPIVVTRSFRCRPSNGEAEWRNIIATGQLEENAIFVGHPDEHKDFVDTFGVNIPYHPVKDFLELANIVAGADLVLCNQGFTYSLAVALGKDTIIEINKIVPLHMNECYFPRYNIQYL